MIVDTHCHLYDKDIPCREYWENYAQVLAVVSNQPVEKAREWLPPQWDITGDNLVKDMDEAGIDKSVILPIDQGFEKWAGDNYSIEDVNRKFFEAAQNHPGRLILFMGLDPRRETVVKLLERGVKEWGVKGVKLMPAAGWYPDDKTFYPFYQKAEELGLVLVFHSGPELYPYRAKYCRPTCLDEIATDFPDLKIICAHAGYCWWEEAAWIASYKQNIYVDLANWQPKIARRPVEEFYERLRLLLNIMGSPKVLFGSDWPGFRAHKRLNNVGWVNAIKELPEQETEAAPGIRFKPQEKEAILGGNAVKLLGL